MIGKQYGFTLVELAIALMVIGLLIGGVLKGQELIKNARVTSMVKYIKDVDTAVMIFRSSYGGYPGNMRNPSRIPNCTATPCTSTSSFPGPGQTGNGQYDYGTKAQNFWIHLSRAGLISNINEDADMYCTGPDNPLGGRDRPGQGPTTDLGNVLFISDASGQSHGQDCNGINGLSINPTRAIDQKMDDGKPYTGNMRTYARGRSGELNCHDDMDDTVYATSKATPEGGCDAYIQLHSLN